MQMLALCKRLRLSMVALRRTLLIMKLTATLILLLCLHASARTYSQEITLSLNNAKLETVFKEIQKQTDYKFVYTKEQLEGSAKVTIKVKDESLEQVLNLCLKDQPLTYTIAERHIIIRIKEKPIETVREPFPVEIRGRVINEQGQPLAGATIMVKGTNNATASNEAGEFFLRSVLPNATLVISNVGYQPTEIMITGEGFVAIQLKLAINTLDETVLIGYGKTTKRLNTGSVSKISGAEIERQPVLNPLSAIQGRASGVFVTTQNGLPGGNITVQIRGKGSINAGTEPLYIVDGIPFSSTPLNSTFSTLSIGITGATSPLNNINPSDIESIEILKDADATAIYGSRAANGVVLITTKKGKPGKTRLDINFFNGISRLATFPDLLNMKEYLELRREAFKNDGATPTASNAPDLLRWDTTKGIDWPKYILGETAMTTNTQVGVSGGTGNTTFMISGNYRNEGTIMRGNQKYRRAGIHMVLQHTSTDKKFSFDLSSSYNADNNRQLSSSIFGVFTLPPNVPIYDNNGNYNWTGITSINPEAVLKRKSISKTNNLLSNLGVRYAILPMLQFKVNLGYNRSELDQIMTYPKQSFDPNTGALSYAYYGTNSIITWIAEPQLEFSKVWKKSNVQLLSGFSYQQTNREGTFTTGSNYNNEDLLEYVGAANTITATNLYTEYKYVSLFGRLRYAFNNRYIANINLRRDGSSRFGPNKQFGNFGSVGVGWIFSEENLFKKISFLSYGKLRGSYGITGNDLISDYQYLSTYGTSGTTYQGITGLAPTRIANADFRWESNKKMEIALELGLFKNRFLFTGSWYNNRSGNQLIDYPLPYTSGPFGHYVVNLPALLSNRGFEFELAIAPIRTKKMTWTITGNASLTRNKLLKYPGLENSSFANTYVIGEDISIVKAYNFTGVNVQTGLPEYEDVNRDGRISAPDDYVIIGKTSPSSYGGVGTDIQYYGFQFSVFFQFSNQYAQGLSTIPGTRSNKFRIALQRWQKPGDITPIPRATITATTPYLNLARSDAAFYDASYWRLKNVSLSYKLSEKIAHKMRMSSCRIYCEGQNLLTWHKEGNLYDPETANGGIAPLMTVVFGIQLTF